MSSAPRAVSSATDPPMMLAAAVPGPRREATAPTTIAIAASDIAAEAQAVVGRVAPS